MVQSIEASKNTIAEKAKAQSACAAVISLDSIRLEHYVGFMREQLPQTVNHFLGIALACLLGVQHSLEECFLLVRHDDTEHKIYHNCALFNGENFR